MARARAHTHMQALARANATHAPTQRRANARERTRSRAHAPHTHSSAFWSVCLVESTARRWRRFACRCGLCRDCAISSVETSCWSASISSVTELMSRNTLKMRCSDSRNSLPGGRFVLGVCVVVGVVVVVRLLLLLVVVVVVACVVVVVVVVVVVGRCLFVVCCRCSSLFALFCAVARV